MHSYHVYKNLHFTTILYTVILEIFVLNFFVCKILVLKYFRGSWQPTKIKTHEIIFTQRFKVNGTV